MKTQFTFLKHAVLLLPALSTFATFYVAQLSSAHAQGTAFTYQGRLNDGANPANGIYDLRFAVYDSTNNPGGLIAGPLTNAPTTVSNGLFTVVLNFGASAFPGADRWLEIGARTNGSVAAYTVLSPRQFLTATPYATRAANFSGAVSDSQLSANVARLNANQTFSGTVNFNSQSNSYAGSFAGNGAGLTNLPGMLQWQVVAGTNQQAQSNQGYIVTNASQVTITLPTAPNMGDTIRVSGVGAEGWKIAQNAGQSILAANLSVIGESWTPHESSRQWSSVASSASGSKLVAVAGNYGLIFISTDSGVNWTVRTDVRQWFAVASSSDGSKLVATVYGGQIFTSTDSGEIGSWAPHASSNNWNSVASSADGNKLVATIYGGQIYTSTDSGTNWTARESSRSWYSVASSADGNKLIAADVSGFLYTSTNSGASWTPRASNSGWVSVASSADGNKLVALSGYIYTSADSGVTWTQRGVARLYEAIASSADGSRLVVVDGNTGHIYLSTDSGVSWTPRTINANWKTVASSADGSKLVAGVGTGGGFIYTSTPTPLATTTTTGTTGYLLGGQSTAIELQYIGNGQFLPVSHEGVIVGN